MRELDLLTSKEAILWSRFPLHPPHLDVGGLLAMRKHIEHEEIIILPSDGRGHVCFQEGDFEFFSFN